MKPLVYFFALLWLATACTSSPGSLNNDAQTFQRHRQLPKVLFVTTGLTNGNGLLPKGAIVAIQTLNQQGAMVRLETRDVLYDKATLSLYNVMVLSTAPGYHDADRRYSLSFMSDAEMENIREFVESGGVLIAGDNVGRNLTDGTDRISLYQRLESQNYPLADCFGVVLSEQNMAGYAIYGEMSDELNGYFKEKSPPHSWTLVPDSLLSDSLQVLAQWISPNDTLPAIIRNRYGKGTAYLLASSDFLEPANQGGSWSAAQIADFYKLIVNDFHKQNHIPLQLNPWPAAHQYAFATTFNSAGAIEEYRRLFGLLEKEKLEAVLFVNGLVEEEVKQFILEKEINTQSSGYAYRNYRHMKYPQAVTDILMNENAWQSHFTGFRFPFTQTAPWGLMALNQHNYMFESSIGANNLNFFHGSVFPYNIVLSNKSFYQATDILEVAPVYHDDYHFLGTLNTNQSPKEVKKHILLYQEYLLNYWERAVKPYNGLMVYMGHPAYVAQNDSTLLAFKELIAAVKKDNTWIAGLTEIVQFRKQLQQLQFFVTEKGRKTQIHISGPPETTVKQCCVKIDAPVEKASALSGNVEIVRDSAAVFLVFDARNGQVITLE